MTYERCVLVDIFPALGPQKSYRSQHDMFYQKYAKMHLKLSSINLVCKINRRSDPIFCFPFPFQSTYTDAYLRQISWFLLKMHHGFTIPLFYVNSFKT